MTLSVIYFNDNKTDLAAVGIRCCADSLISRKDGGELTPHAMKILKLNLCYDPICFLSTPHPIINPSIGFTFAGNLNVAMVTYTLMSHLCEYIQPTPGYQNTFPSIRTLSNLIAKILHSYISDFSVLQTYDARVEIILFGYCSQEKDFKAFYISPVITGHLEIKVEEVKIREMPYFAIGSGKKLLEQKYAETNKFSPDLIRDIINDPASEQHGVGGFFQRGWSNKVGIQLYCDAMKIHPNSFEAPFCGFNIPVINLGTHIIGLPMFADVVPNPKETANAEE